MLNDYPISDYQTLDEFYRSEKKNIMIDAKSMFFNSNSGVLTITEADGKKTIITREDFSSHTLNLSCVPREGFTA